LKYTSLEEVWDRFENKYQALNVAALEARRVIEGLHRGEISLNQNIIEYSLQRLHAGEIKYRKLTEAEVQALTRESFGEPGFGSRY